MFNIYNPAIPRIDRKKIVNGFHDLRFIRSLIDLENVFVIFVFSERVRLFGQNRFDNYAVGFHPMLPNLLLAVKLAQFYRGRLQDNDIFSIEEVMRSQAVE